MTRMNWKKAKKYKSYEDKNTPLNSHTRQAAYAEKQWVRSLSKTKKKFLKGEKLPQSTDNNRILIGDGNNCPKCKQPMKRYEHDENWLPRSNSYYFKYWDTCKGCRRVQHYECAKIYVDEKKQKHLSNKVIWGDKWED